MKCRRAEIYAGCVGQVEVSNLGYLRLEMEPGRVVTGKSIWVDWITNSADGKLVL